MKKANNRRIDGIAVGLFFLLYTLIVHYSSLKTLPIDKEIYGMENATELFHLFKSQVLIWVAVAFFVGLLMSLLTREHRLEGDKRFLTLLSAYGALSLLSYALATHKDLAWRGAINRYEGLPVLLSYAVISLCFYFITTESKARRWFFAFFAANNVLIYLIGILQTAGYNLLTQEWLLKVMIWPAQNVMIKSLGQSGVRAAYATLGNQNFMGSYAMLSITLNLFMFNSATTKKSKLLWGALATLGLATLLSSYSLAGLVGLIVILPLLAATCNIDKLLWKGVAQNICIAVLALGMFFLIAPDIDWLVIKAYILAWILAATAVGIKKILSGRNERLSYKTLMVSGLAIITAIVLLCAVMVSTMQRLPLPLSQISIQGKYSELVLYGEKIILSYDNHVLHLEQVSTAEKFVMDGPGKLAFTTKVGHQIEIQFFKDPEVEGLYGLIFKEPYLVFMMGDFNGKSLIKLVGNNRSAIEPEAAKTVKWLDGLERIGSGRGYILSRSLPLIPQYLLLGAGPDHFVSVFPQRDVTGKSGGLGSPYLVVDKPHNWYVQMAINTGLVSALCVIGAIMLLVHKALKYIIGRVESTDMTPIVITIACVGYAVTCLFNDSVVSVAPIFWAMLGSGHALLDRFVK